VKNGESPKEKMKSEKHVHFIFFSFFQVRKYRMTDGENDNVDSPIGFPPERFPPGTDSLG
jgi:hypothetical protein